MEIDLQIVKKFVLKASQSTYASGDQSLKQVQSDKSTTINYSDKALPDYTFHDNYFGGEPYGGREVVFYKEDPIWMMTYYGWVNQGIVADKVYEVLMSALRLSTIDMPYRGPAEYIHGDYKYINSVEGDFENFYGIEEILLNGVQVYQARYMGGLVDRH